VPQQVEAAKGRGCWRSQEAWCDRQFQRSYKTIHGKFPLAIGLHGIALLKVNKPGNKFPILGISISAEEYQ
jgi:hypothetical protein